MESLAQSLGGVSSHGVSGVEGDRERESLRSSLGMVFPSLFTAASRKDADRAYVGSGTDSWHRLVSG